LFLNVTLQKVKIWASLQLWVEFCWKKKTHVQMYINRLLWEVYLFSTSELNPNIQQLSTENKIHTHINIFLNLIQFPFLYASSFWCVYSLVECTAF
jgi:hypothetical protein